MNRFQAMTVFAKVVEQGSFARAAELLSISASACSRQVAELEAHLDTRLLNRTTRRLSLTESGQGFYERCVQLLADLEEAEQAAAQTAARPRGTLRITTSINFGGRRDRGRAPARRGAHGRLRLSRLPEGARHAEDTRGARAPCLPHL